MTRDPDADLLAALARVVPRSTSRDIAHAEVGASDLESLAGLFAAGPWRFFRSLRQSLRVLGGSIPGEESIFVRPDAAKRWFDRGHTLYLMNADATHERLRGQLSGLCRALGYASGYVGVFVSPPGAVSDWHFDHLDNLTIQLDGEKRWEVASQPEVLHPRGNYGVGEPVPATLRYCADRLAGMAAPRPEASYTLGPRSAVYVPQGLWHRVTSLGPTSVSVSFGMRRPSRLDALLRQVEELAASDWWRAPASEGDDLLQALRQEGSVPPTPAPIAARLPGASAAGPPRSISPKKRRPR